MHPPLLSTHAHTSHAHSAHTHSASAGAQLGAQLHGGGSKFAHVQLMEGGGVLPDLGPNWQHVPEQDEVRARLGLSLWLEYLVCVFQGVH